MSPAKPARLPDRSAAAALGQQLKYSRTAAKFATQAALADKLGVHPTIVTKAETGAQLITQRAYEKWMDECGVGGQLRSALDALWLLARAREDPVAHQIAPWAQAEVEAHTLRYWEPLLFPGSVQTPDYARTLFIAWGHSPQRAEEMVQARAERRTIFDRGEPPDVTIVVWEPVLTTLIGSAEIMRGQLDWIRDLSQRPNIHFHVLPSSLGANMGLGGLIELATTSTAEYLMMEGFSETVVTANDGQVRRASATFNTVRSDALPRAASRAELMKAMEAWDTTIRGGSPATAPPPEPTAV